MVLFDWVILCLVVGSIIGIGERILDKEPDWSLVMGGFAMYLSIPALILGLLTDWVSISGIVPAIFMFVIWVIVAPPESDDDSDRSNSSMDRSSTTVSNQTTGSHGGSSGTKVDNSDDSASSSGDSTKVFDPTTSDDNNNDTKVFSKEK